MMIPLIEDDCEIKKEVPKEFFSPQSHPPPQRLRRGRRDHRGFCFFAHREMPMGKKKCP